MLCYVLLIWVGLQLNAPTWFWVVLGGLMLLQICRFGWELYKKGLEKGKED